MQWMILWTWHLFCLYHDVHKWWQHVAEFIQNNLTDAGRRRGRGRCAAVETRNGGVEERWAAAANKQPHERSNRHRKIREGQNRPFMWRGGGKEKGKSRNREKGWKSSESKEFAHMGLNIQRLTHSALCIGRRSNSVSNISILIVIWWFHSYCVWWVGFGDG